MEDADSQRQALVSLASHVQQMPYRWPAPPDAASTRDAGAGTCAGKHALLAEDLQAAGIHSRPLLIVGPLVPDLWPDLRERAGDLLEVHECLTVQTGWAGPLLVDVTWHPAAVRAGLPGTLDWDGGTDMAPAVEPTICHAVRRPPVLRAQKEALRARLYSRDDRDRRDEVLAEIAKRAARLPLNAPMTSAELRHPTGTDEGG